ncbi:hypothetical protein AGRO_1005 [Agrobacterium sp. ATCC 31749]|nr:hypothetical protein AGRO_1005 [Agrobacterium sp. ATCC 31749]
MYFPSDISAYKFILKCSSPWRKPLKFGACIASPQVAWNY